MTLQESKSNNPPKNEFEKIEKPDLFHKLNDLKSDGARFVHITGRDIGDKIELNYHFEKGMDITTLIVDHPKTDELLSITSIFPASFLAENELQDHLKVKVSGLSVDFGGKLLRIAAAEQDTLLKPAVGPQPFIQRFMGKCREECPGDVNAPKYIRQIAEGDPQGGYNTVLEAAALPACLGRVCFAPCQDACRQERNDTSIQIRLLKRYTADSMPNLKRDVKRAPLNGKKIAIVGGGPTGVGCAFHLGMMGYDVTVLEKDERCGGAMLWGIPKYRLPKDVLEDEVQARFLEAGVTLKANVEVKDLSALQSEYDGVFVAIGAQGGFGLRIEGEDAEGVMDFRDILRAVNVENKTPNLGKKVAVIGGGNSSMDACRVAKRLGSESVTLYYRRTAREMPASAHEVHGSMEEGIHFEYLGAPVKIEPGKPLKVTFVKMKLGEPDTSGRQRPEPIEGSEYVVEVDTLITAVGQSVVIPESYGMAVSRRGAIVVDENYKTNLDNVWAGGDVVNGPRSVIESLSDGRKTASAIDKHFGGNGWPDAFIDMTEYVSRPIDLNERKKMPVVPVRELNPESRVKNFDEIELGYNKEEALREANRCWKCDWNE